MLTCSDCKDDSCPEFGRDMNACDSFNGEEDMQQDVYGDDVYTLKDAQSELKELYAVVAILSTSIAEVERKFNTIIAAVVKAAGPEEER